MNVTVTMDAPTPDDVSAVVTLAYLLTSEDGQRIDVEDLTKMFLHIDAGLDRYFTPWGSAEDRFEDWHLLPELCAYLRQITRQIEGVAQRQKA